jgi:hypothetical protein
MNARVSSEPRRVQCADWRTELDEPAYAVVTLAALPEAVPLEHGAIAEVESHRWLRERFALQVDVAARWQVFLNAVYRAAPDAGRVVDAVVEGVRPLLQFQWPLGSLDLDDQVAISWEDHGQFYAHLDLCADGTGTWFGKNLRTGSYDGGEVTSPEQAREAMVAWLGTQDRAA